MLAQVSEKSNIEDLEGEGARPKGGRNALHERKTSERSERGEAEEGNWLLRSDRPKGGRKPVEDQSNESEQDTKEQCSRMRSDTQTITLEIIANNQNHTQKAIKKTKNKATINEKAERN